MLDLLLLSLASWYVTHVLVTTSGPREVFTRLRARYPLGGLLLCEYCLIIWVAIAWYIVMRSPAHDAIYPFAAAGAGMLLYRQTGGQHGD